MEFPCSPYRLAKYPEPKMLFDAEGRYSDRVKHGGGGSGSKIEGRGSGTKGSCDKGGMDEK